MHDTIYRQDAIDAIKNKVERYTVSRESKGFGHVEWSGNLISEDDAINAIAWLPSAQPEQTYCNYCHADSDGFTMPIIEENGHAIIYGNVLHLKANQWRGKVQIKYCPMCGRRLKRCATLKRRRT